MGQAEAFAKVAFPDRSSKEVAWKALTGANGKISSNQRWIASKYFHNFDHPEISEAYVERFFDFVCNKADWSRIWYMKDIFSNLFPYNLCSQELLTKSQNCLKEMKSLSLAGQRIWLEANDVPEKRMKIRQYDKNWLIQEPIQCQMEVSEEVNEERHK